jgi:uncharacterized protein YodC (DUF2158 family)
MRFSEGDFVSRKIGGPLMTVEDSRDDGLVAVVWLDLENRVHRDCFSPNTLNKWHLVEEA